MLLYTLQGDQFDLTGSFPVDHSRSPYYRDVQGVHELYGELFGRLETDQIIWCSVYQEKTWSGETRDLWVLDVPEERVLVFTHAYAWNRLLRIQDNYPEKQYTEWRREAAIAAQGDNDLYESMVKAKMAEYDSQFPVDRNQLWDCCLSCNPTAEEAVALVRHPVLAEWVHSGPSWWGPA